MSVLVDLGLDLISAADMRMATTHAQFSIKEIELGITADLGSLQRLPKILSQTSVLYEWSLTGRTFDAMEAEKYGLVHRVFPDTLAMQGISSSRLFSFFFVQSCLFMLLLCV